MAFPPVPEPGFVLVPGTIARPLVAAASCAAYDLPMPKQDPTTLSATALAAAIRGGDLTARAALEAHLERIEHREPDIRAWTFVDADGAREIADAPDRGPVRGPLHGLPFGVKDIIDVAGLSTECGSPIYRGRRASADAACVAAARAAGAIPLGKTVTTEFATFAPP